MTIAYGLMLAISIGLLIVYCFVIKNKEPWLLIFYASICIVQLGYLLLSISNTVESALLFNKIAYLGQISLLTSMFMTVVNACGFKPKKYIPIILLLVGVLVFAMVCTTGYLPWYYKEVSLEYVDGASKLIKEYGPLHSLYLVYILSMYALMIVTIVHSFIAKKVTENKQAGLLIALVSCNIVTWIIEKFIDWNFEFLSISYILSETMVFFLYWLMQDYIHKNDIPDPIVVEEKGPIIIVDSETKAEKIKKIIASLPEGTTLSVRQIDVLKGILEGKSRKEIAADLYLSENTVKMHTASLYRVLGVSNRDELRALFKDKK